MNVLMNPCLILCAVLGFTVITTELTLEQVQFTMVAILSLAVLGVLMAYCDHRRKMKFLAKDPDKAIWWEECEGGYRSVTNTYKLAAAIEAHLAKHHPDFEMRDGTLVRKVEGTSNQ